MDIVLFIARLCLSAVFLASAYDKTIRHEEARAEFRAAKVPAPNVTLVVVVAMQWICSLALITGLFVSLAAYCLAAFIALATFWVHRFWEFQGQQRLEVSRRALGNISIFGGLLLAGIVGPGNFILI